MVRYYFKLRRFKKKSVLKNIFGILSTQVDITKDWESLSNTFEFILLEIGEN